MCPLNSFYMLFYVMSSLGWIYVIFDTNNVMHIFLKISLPPIAIDNRSEQNVKLANLGMIWIKVLKISR